ncbi:hypothetical protein HK104_010883, partial [Borealophlyctis nickersoniae]
GLTDYHQLDSLNIGVHCDSTALQVGQVVCVQPCLSVYSVKSGDGCYSIAQAAQLSDYHVIDTMNPGVKCDSTPLRIGQAVCLKKCTKYDKVRSGEGCYVLNPALYFADFAKRNGLADYKILDTLNPGLKCDVKGPELGQSLCVASMGKK